MAGGVIAKIGRAGVEHVARKSAKSGARKLGSKAAKQTAQRFVQNGHRMTKAERAAFEASQKTFLGRLGIKSGEKAIQWGQIAQQAGGDTARGRLYGFASMGAASFANLSNGGRGLALAGAGFMGMRLLNSMALTQQVNQYGRGGYGAGYGW